MENDTQTIGRAGTREVGERLSDALQVVLETVPQTQLKRADVQLALMNIMSSLSVLLTCEEEYLTVQLPPASQPQAGTQH